MARLDEIKENIRSLANPSAPYWGAAVNGIIENTPAVAWLAYSIHGDEISGTDASVEVAYQLAAGEDERTRMLRDSLIVIIDPSENPDGRERYLSMLQSHFTYVPSTDAQALQHSGFWPWGRGNHYLYDLNRDWILLENVETQGKVAAILEWNPQMLVDAHEMGAYSSFLFNPPREPINKNIPDTIQGWWRVYSDEHAEAFDEYGWNYYTKEWHEEWYPGYGSAWAGYIGAVGLLYEQSGGDGMPTKQRDGYIQTYRETVHHQFIGSIANVTTTAKYRTDHLRGFYQVKVDAVEAGKKDSPRRFVIPSQPYPTRAAKLAQTLLTLGVRVERTSGAGSVGGAHDIYGQTHRSYSVPAGSYIVELAQPLRPLIKGMLEFDPHFTKEFLDEERREQEKWGDSRLYEFSAWSLALAYDCGVVWTDGRVSAASASLTEAPELRGAFHNDDSRYGWVIDYRSDHAPIAALRLLQQGYKVQAADRPFRADGVDYSAGSLVIRRKYNDVSVVEALEKIAAELAVEINSVRSALVQEGSDLGADSFRPLELPRIGIFGGPGVDFTSYGSLWHQLDQELKVGHSLLNAQNLGFLDLDRYNVLIMP
ncbi:MAG TPA: M14 family zinc carboxypeptidase, partial [candidate division Zixibacteria bacterium]|nr:M14 family zinc carboxypeptidase [candidate division Zixibacteria bacterium]